MNKISKIRRKYIKWNIDDEVKKKTRNKGQLAFEASVNSEKLTEPEDNKVLLKGQIDYKADFKNKDGDIFASYNVIYEIDISADKKMKDLLDENTEETKNIIEKKLLRIAEPYFRYDFEKILFESDLPTNLIPLEFWEND